MPIIHTWGESWDMSKGIRTEYSSGELSDALASLIIATPDQIREQVELRDRMEHDA